MTTTDKFPPQEYDFADLIVEIGSCLGLWLGLSLLGLFDVVTIAIKHVIGGLSEKPRIERCKN